MLLSPQGSGGFLSLPLYLNALLIVMEVIRRSVWCVLRLENEQLRNTQVSHPAGLSPPLISTSMAWLSSLRLEDV